MLDGVDGKRDGGQHKEDRRNGSGFGKRRGCAARTKRGLAALSAESRGDVSGLTALQQDNDNQKQTYHYMDDGDEDDHGVKTVLKFFRMIALVRKGGFEPPRLSAPPPQDGVSASSTTSALPSYRGQKTSCEGFHGNRIPAIHDPAKPKMLLTGLRSNVISSGNILQCKRRSVLGQF
jgi:hypothetical protein